MKLSISTVSAESGIAKEVLRKWETRYGFPIPGRDATGNRVYTPEQLDRLKLLKKLIDDGMRPGEVVPLGVERLTALSRDASREAGPADTGLIAHLQARDPVALQAYLRSQLARLGPHDFVVDLMPRMNTAVGEAWATQAIAVRDEHLYSEMVHRIVREEISRCAARGSGPRVLLTTPPGELHTLGLLMLEAALALQGAHCISLGAQSPLEEIALAAQEYETQVVALSFSDSFPRRKIYTLLKELRALLPARVQLWVGGAGAVGAQKMPRGAVMFSTIAAAVTALEKLRREEAAHPDQGHDAPR